MVAVIPPEGDFYADPIALACYHDRRAQERMLGAIKVSHESFEPSLIEELFLFTLGMAFIGQDDVYA